MNKKIRSFYNLFGVAIGFLFLLIACQQVDKNAPQQEKAKDDGKGEESLLAINASQHGVKYPETFVLMQNRHGVRIEYNVDRSNLQLWISPQAWKSMDYRDRNFSNRDDHCKLFERIMLPDLKFTGFQSTDFDPFHSAIKYKDQDLHILNFFDAPGLMLWFENGGNIDFKSHREDKALARTGKEFIVEHRERNRVFDFAAIIGKGDGSFRHQLVLDEGRGIYTRAELAPGQPLVIAGELKREQIAAWAREVASSDKQTVLERNEEKVGKATQNGQFQLNDRPGMQKLLGVNRRIVLSMQDGGFMRSTNQYIYYLLWFRDGGMNTAHITYSGWPKVAKDHCSIALLNPNISYEEPKGKFFGQLMSGPITKWEEDGLFFATWPAFAYWTQTGDNTFNKGLYMDNLEAGMDWLERRCYDKDRGLFGRYHYCETPLTGSRGDGYDNAVGKPTYKWASTYEGDTIVRSYDIYMNMLTYSTYRMLAAMKGDSPKAQEYFGKAEELEKNMKFFFETDSLLPSYGKLLNRQGGMVMSKPYGMDRTDYRWALSIPPLTPHYPQKYKQYRQQLLKDMTAKPKGIFICAYNAILTSMDNLIHDEDEMMAALDYLVPQSVRAGEYLAMPYTIPELVDEEDGDPFHDVRPLVYSIAPWLSAVTNFSLHRLPFGIAARPTKYINKLDNYAYKDALLDVEYTGEGQIKSLVLNGQVLENTYQIPEYRLQKGENKLKIQLSENTKMSNILVSSNLKLNNVQVGQKIAYELVAHGKNVLAFANLDKKATIMDKAGQPVLYKKKEMDNLVYLSFPGQGKVTVNLD